MSRYEPLWDYVKESGSERLTLTLDIIKDITGFPIDHSFLTYKKELLDYGFRGEKISLKKQTVSFEKL